jgi:hypothetical protein
MVPWVEGPDMFKAKPKSFMLLMLQKPWPAYHESLYLSE